MFQGVQEPFSTLETKDFKCSHCYPVHLCFQIPLDGAVTYMYVQTYPSYLY